MELKKLIAHLLKLSADVDDIEKSVVYAFMAGNNYEYNTSVFFNDYFENLDLVVVQKTINIFNESEMSLSIYTLVEIFEMLVPNDVRKENGTVYTPVAIKDYIINSLINSKNIPTVCDPACGCGSFLLSAAEYLHEKYNIEYGEIFDKYIFGVDIIEHNIEKCIVLFNLLALTTCEVLDNKFNLMSGSSLNLDWKKGFKFIPQDGFDIVIGNPPYVRSKNISESTRREMSSWSTANTGNADLYIPFYELGLELLNDSGKLGYISPNTFIQSVNGRSLRKYLKERKYNISLLDFREAQVFKNVTSYTCITLIDKSCKDGKINYALLNGNSSLRDYYFTEYEMDSFIDTNPWRMGEKEIDDRIKKIENVGVRLDSYKIRNGLATLKNDVYFYMPVSEDTHFYYRNYKNVVYKIEKGICIDVAKPNVIKSEEELIEKMEKAIFPYVKSKAGYTVIDEKTMQELYPCTYKFLRAVRDELENRDKGKGNYSEWYAYGRTQGMMNFGSKLLIPYISDTPVAVLSPNNNVLFYCGYAVFSDEIEELELLKKILESRVFWYYISNTSKPYSKGYMSFAKNYIKNFGIPVLSDNQRKTLLNMTCKIEADDYIEKLYNICL